MISIITPILNGERFIERIIFSVKALNIPYEHLVVDGGSTDRTLEIADANGVTIVHQEGAGGMYAAIDQGILASKSEYCAYVNCDDAVVPRGFERLYWTAVKTNADLVYGDAYMCHEPNRKLVLRSGTSLFRIWTGAGILPFVQPAAVFSRRAFDIVGGFGSKFRIIGDLAFYRKIGTRPEMRIKYLRATSAVFLKYGESLGDRNKNLYEHEIELAGIKRPAWAVWSYPLLLRLNNICSQIVNHLNGDKKTVRALINDWEGK
jgi:glycosyltransferase involved in cell wall biosynthesis